MNGYPCDAELPDYRKLGYLNVRGTFTGPFGSALNDAVIPQTSINQEH